MGSEPAMLSLNYATSTISSQDGYMGHVALGNMGNSDDKDDPLPQTLSSELQHYRNYALQLHRDAGHGFPTHTMHDVPLSRARPVGVVE